jgi:hypothetical protein
MSEIKLKPKLRKLLIDFERSVREHSALMSFPTVDRPYVSRRYNKAKRALREYLLELEENAS